ncbi:MAG TPA: chromate transporter [Chloroflexota bacterium]|nr:chromate transporter [Chloroflexota bacterium]
MAWAFTRIGLLSFGGGSASQLLMRKELVWKHGWLTDIEYNRIWQLSKLTVGIQQIGQVILYGQKLAGRRGIAVAVAGFMLPSVFLTIVMSIVLVAVIGNRYIEDALRLVIPLTGGMTMAIALQMWSPEVPRLPRHVLRLVGQGVAVLICSVLVGVVRLPVPLIMVAALTLGALLP